ncbi:DNA-3-methyladenine glycosylase I [Ammoniphilus sp. CFH 90114]|uniref:DNA-3-methyladenine glycosylase I n=1 Tax=Ammoniphilus sp. CFH 90114 TaxID=2493665 RepID=UPI00100EEB73|nr:DNA-3-methyladenine glycosylase I [Ammoniphilus sp. CFH 90114]RXT08047.1 DNA-3-methyladenine glycosylase I [Ammoniphilus sp. CFH 90114]
MQEKKRCGWVTTDPLYIKYHDEEWGVPVRDSQKLFEMLCLEGAQAGLSWITVLKKRENYRTAFDNFDPQRIAQYDEQKINILLSNEGIIRHRGKIEAFITNAKCYLEMTHKGEDFSTFLWSFIGGNPVINDWTENQKSPSKTEVSDAMSKALKKKGFKFVGSTICYAFMQATGMVDDHDGSCYKRS